MFYFIFIKNADNLEGTFYKFCQNLSDLNLIQSDYKIIQDSEENFNAVKYRTKKILKYNNDTIIFDNDSKIYKNKEELKKEILSLQKNIKSFLDNNVNHSLYNVWNDYYNQLSSLNLDDITYPLNKSLEQYFNDIGQPSYNILQLP